MVEVQLGLYRHFKGGYYFANNYLKDESNDGEVKIQYFDVMNPNLGYFTRSFNDWNADISDREDNVTGQTKRFERVSSIDNCLGDYSTDRLIEELRGRGDSPYQFSDIEGLKSKVISTEYVVCVGVSVYDASGFYTLASFDTREEAEKYCKSNTKYAPRARVYKRVFIED